MKAVTVAPRTARLLRLDSLGVTGPPCEPCRGYAADG